MNFKKLFCGLLGAGLVGSAVMPVFAAEQYVSNSSFAEENGYGVVVTVPTEEDLAGEYGSAYAAAGYKATFTVDVSQLDFGNGNTVDIDDPEFEVYVGGTIQFYDPAEVKIYASAEEPEYTGKDGTDVSTVDPSTNVYTAYEYQEGFFTSGYDIVRSDYSKLHGDESYDWNLKDALYAGEGSILYEMEKVSDYVYTVSMPLPSQEFFYKYFVTPYTGTNRDGTENPVAAREGFAGALDPSNMPVINPASNADPGWSYFFVGDGSEAISNQEYIFPRTDGKTGTFEFGECLATDDETPIYTAVYLPYGYDSSKTYKTIYLEHGGGGDETEWFQIGAVANIMDNLIAEGLTEEAIVVTWAAMPIWELGGKSPMDPIDYDEVWENVRDRIVPYIEENYSVSTDSSDRAMAGLSQGGRMASRHLIQDPSFFSYIGCFSGFECDPEVSPADWDVEAMKNVYIYTSAGNIDMALGFYGQDPAQDGRAAYTMAEFNKLLDDAGIEYETEIFQGTHDWSVWRASFSSFAQKLWK